AMVKWPNDIFLGDRKLAGVLIQSIVTGSQRHLLVGVGINANIAVSHLPQDVAQRAASLQSTLGAPVDLDLLTNSAARPGETALHAVASAPLEAMRSVHARLWGLGRAVSLILPAGPAAGIIRGITDSGQLIAEIDGAQHRISSAEISAEDDAGLVGAPRP